MLNFLKFFLENYQSSHFMDAIIWPVLIENIGIYISGIDDLSMTSYRTIVCVFMIARLCLFHCFPLALRSFQKT